MAETTSIRGWRLGNAFAVPGTGHPRRRGRYYRAPHNVSIKRALLSSGSNLKGEKVPPNSYDDIARASIYDRNWKRFRFTRWKEAA